LHGRTFPSQQTAKRDSLPYMVWVRSLHQPHHTTPSRTNFAPQQHLWE